MLLKFLDALVKYLRLRVEGVDLATKFISRRGNKILWAGSWFFFSFFFFYSLLSQGEGKTWHSKLATLLWWVDFPSLPSAPGPAEAASRSARFFASNVWPMAASWSFLRPSVQPQNWPPSKPARKMTVPASGFSLTGQRYVWSSGGDDERGINEKAAPQIDTYRRREHNRTTFLTLWGSIIGAFYTTVCD